MPTDLRCDIAHLGKLIRKAMTLHRAGSIQEATMLADIRDYFFYLTLDGLGDEALARSLILTFTRLQSWLTDVVRDYRSRKVDPTAPIFYGAFLFTLEQLLSLRHALAMLPGEKISREDFTRSWRRTAEKLGLT